MIDGTYSLLHIDFGSGFLPVGCLTSNGISEEIETLDSTTRDSKGWKTQVLTNQSYSIDFSGVVINTLFDNGDPTKVSYDRIKSIKRSRQLISWKITNSVDFHIEFGKAQIKQISSEGNIDEFMSFSANLVGYGVLYQGQSNDANLGLDEKLDTII